MISEKDLRIGNWVILDWDGEKRNQQIDGVSNSGAVFIGEWDDDFGLESLYPIPLTPEILLACGFEADGADFIIGRFKIYSGHHEFWYWDAKGFDVELKSLHQLQNLYYCLTGTELTYSPKIKI